jgi:glycosyltransferase involved in cell wall biosynthesis
MIAMRTVLFHRDFENFTGGHLKVWNYFNHVEAAEGFRAQIYFSPSSKWDESNPWFARRAEVLPDWNPGAADALFFGAWDWQMLPAAERDHYPRPIINLIQHVHHGDLGYPLSAFLGHRAVRVCVSEEVRAAIEAAGRVNGPVVVIPNGIDLAGLPVPPADAGNAGRRVDWLVCGLKQDRPAIARRLAATLNADPARWGRAALLTKLRPRAEFLAAIAAARRVVLLPRETEGFYLPMLEAMALGTLPICPDCVGNRSFRAPGFPALTPAGFEEDSLLAAMAAAQSLPPADEARFLETARGIADRHTLARERASFHALLASLPSLW